MTHMEIASSIRNRVADGLSGNINDQAFSIDQLYDEIDLARADFINKYTGTTKLNTTYLLQNIDRLNLQCLPFANAECCAAYCEGADCVPGVEIPTLSATYDNSAIEYLGIENKQEKLLVYYDTSDMYNHQFRIRTKHKPFAWVDTSMNSHGKMTIYFFNLGIYNPLQWISIRAVFNHPSEVRSLDPDYLQKEYPAPLHMQNAIIDTLTEKYIRYFRTLNLIPVPNTQTDPVT